VHVVRSALGAAAGRATFNINASRPTNSLLPTVANLNADLESLCRPVEQVEVAVTTIDEYCAGCELRRVDIVKLDLQGYDFLALTGAKATLEKTDVVLVEVWFQEVYRGSARFPQILALMIESGFELYTLCGLHYGVNDELIWADAIFFRPDSTTPGRIPSPRF
jgi:FkbM family methyltransferase